MRVNSVLTTPMHKCHIILLKKEDYYEVIKHKNPRMLLKRLSEEEADQLMNTDLKVCLRIDRVKKVYNFIF